MQARTFHSAALKQLRYFWPRSVGGTLWPVLEHKLRLVAIAARRANAGTDAATLRDLASEIEWSKATLAGPQDYLAAVAKHQRDTPLPAETVAKVFEVYESVKQEAEQLDFDDLLLHTCAVLEDDEAVAREFRSRYRCFVVDEYQDVTPLQQRTLDAWLGGRDQLTVVGDANQTIYSFAGASPGYLLGFERRFPNATVVRLERDYRSTPQVVSLANRIIAGSSGIAAKYRLRLTAALPDGPATHLHRAPRRTHRGGVGRRGRGRADRGRHAGLRDRRALPDQRAVRGLRGRADRAGRAVRGPRWRALLRPGRSAAGAGVSLRNAAPRARPTPDSADGRTTVPTPVPRRRPTGRARTLVPTVRGLLGTIGLSDEPPPRRSAARPVGFADRHRHGRRGTGRRRTDRHAGSLAAELDQRAEAQHAPTVEGVTLASLHAAKGLEWDAVFLVGLTDGTLPIQHAETPEEIEEERRLFYVGDHQGADPAGAVLGAVPDPGWPADPAPQPVPHRHRAGLGDLAGAHRGRTGTLPGLRREAAHPGAGEGRPLRNLPVAADPDLVDALRSWRKSRSTEASVPAFVVFSDATLLAIAERRPTDNAALLSIPGHRPGEAGRLRAGRHRHRQPHPLSLPTRSMSDSREYRPNGFSRIRSAAHPCADLLTDLMFDLAGWSAASRRPASQCRVRCAQQADDEPDAACS